MKRNTGDLQNNNQGRPPKLPVQQKRNILRQTRRLQEEMGNFFVKRVMVEACIPPSISEETVRSSAKGFKNELKLRLKFVVNVQYATMKY